METPRIMVVEDDPPILEMLGVLLRDEEMEPIEVSRTDVAVDRATDVRPHGFVIDIMLHGMSGIELAQRLRDRSFEKTPMIAISASMLMLRAAAESGVFDAHFQKPFDIRALVATIQRLLNQAEETGE